jgi:hypothetical protein
MTMSDQTSDFGAESHAVRGGKGLRPKGKIVLKMERGARRNYDLLGRRLAASSPTLYRNSTEGHGLLRVLEGGRVQAVLKGSRLAPILVDGLDIRVTKDGKLVGQIPAAGHLNTMLRTEEFLKHFRPLDQVIHTPIYLNDFSLVRPGYNDGGPGGRILYLGPPPEVRDSTDTINQFLDVMPFAGNADRTNTVAAALTVMLHTFWPGQKPLVLVTATKSHAGKGTITEFVRGPHAKADLLYESLDWPMQCQFQKQVRASPEVALVVLDNVRLDSAGGRAKLIRSAFIESFVTNAEITLASPGAGEAIRLANGYVVVINTNDGLLSPDLLIRSLPIHLAPRGNVEDRNSPIGNPKLEFLPAHLDRIQAELRGMVERWKAAGRPLDDTAKHPMTLWARTIGGILKVSGYTEFLANFAGRKAVGDPTREALAILAAARTGKALRPAEWAKVAVEQGLARTLFPANARDTDKGRERAIGVILSRHLEETFDVATETARLRVRLEGGCRRWVAGKNPHVRYVFTSLSEEVVAEEDAGAGGLVGVVVEEPSVGGIVMPDGVDLDQYEPENIP